MLAVVRSRITDLERLSVEEESVRTAREAVIHACRRLAAEINAQRSRLGLVE